MNRQDLRDRFRGVVGVTVTPMDNDYEVDLGRMHALTQWWVENGLTRGRAMLKVVSVMGEFSQLTDNEWPTVVRTAVQAADGKVDIIAGTHYKDTKRTIQDALIAQDIGAIGLQIAPPAMNDPNQDDILRFYSDVSDAIDIGVMVYNTPWQRCGAIDADTLHKMADFEHIVALKWASHEGCPAEEMDSLAPKFNLIENGSDRVGFHKHGGSGFLDKSAVAYPPHELKMWDLLEAKRYDEAQALWDTVDEPIRRLAEKAGKRSGGQARFKKMIMNAMGHNVGHQRPPTLPASTEEITEVRDLLASLGWPVPGTVSAAAD
jgi:4-hydroxy-tetrahydrodipicolinate synthase